MPMNACGCHWAYSLGKEKQESIQFCLLHRAAPELLEALITLNDALGHERHAPNEDCSACDVDILIAKAEGR
jgi:hypothetical protein